MSIKDQISKITAELKESLGKKNLYEVPRISKVVVNVGVGTYLLKGGNTIDDVVSNIAAIAGQQPVVKKSKLAVSNFKLRKGMNNGVMVTLRGKKMYDFLDKLITVTLPQVRDFRGISKNAFDKKGNYNLGLKDITVFPEINLDDISKTHGVQITIKIEGGNPAESRMLLDKIGMPFEKAQKN